MAHHDKMTKGNTSGGINLLDHDRRASLEQRPRSNPNIDAMRSPENRDESLYPGTPAESWNRALEVAQSCSKRKIRNDMVVMSCDVVHLPKNWDEISGGADPIEFFERVALPFYRNRYAVMENHENEVSAVIHFDETTPHLHYKYVPVVDDGDRYRLSHKQVNGLKDLQSLHGDLQRYAEDAGYVGLDLYDEKRAAEREKAYEMPEYRAEMERKKEELEKELVEKRNQLDEISIEIENETQRLERLRLEGERADQRIEGLESVASEIRRFENAPKSRKVEILNRINALCNRVIERLKAGFGAASPVAAKRLATDPPAEGRAPSFSSRADAGPGVIGGEAPYPEPSGRAANRGRLDGRRPVR